MKFLFLNVVSVWVLLMPEGVRQSDMTHKRRNVIRIEHTVSAVFFFFFFFFCGFFASFTV